MRCAKRWSESAPSSSKRSSATALSKGMRGPWLMTYNDESWRTTMVPHDSLEPAKTSPPPRLCSVVSRRLLPPKSAKLSRTSVSCSGAWQSSRQRAHGHDGTGMTSVVTPPPGATWLTLPSTKRHPVRGPPAYPRSRNTSAPSAMPMSS